MTYPLPPNPRTGRPHLYAEAFCLMLYRTDDGREEEWLWNSRDGITPFVIRLRSGTEAAHVDWHRDQYVPNHVPEVGSRIFVSMTPQYALDYGKRAVEAHRKGLEEGSEVYAGIPLPTAEDVAFHMLAQFWPCSPAVVEVTVDMLHQFRPVVRFPGSPRAG